MYDSISFTDSSGIDGEIVLTESAGDGFDVRIVGYSGPVGVKEYVEDKDGDDAAEDLLEELLIDMPQELPVQSVTRVDET